MSKPQLNSVFPNASLKRDSHKREDVLREIKLALITAGSLSLDRNAGGGDPYNSKASRDVWGNKRRSD